MRRIFTICDSNACISLGTAYVKLSDACFRKRDALFKKNIIGAVHIIFGITWRTPSRWPDKVVVLVLCYCPGGVRIVQLFFKF